MDLGKDPALMVPRRGHLESGGIPRGAWIPGPWARPVTGGWGFQAVQGQVGQAGCPPLLWELELGGYGGAGWG